MTSDIRKIVGALRAKGGSTSVKAANALEEAAGQLAMKDASLAVLQDELSKERQKRYIAEDQLVKLLLGRGPP